MTTKELEELLKNMQVAIPLEYSGYITDEKLNKLASKGNNGLENRIFKTYPHLDKTYIWRIK